MSKKRRDEFETYLSFLDNTGCNVTWANDNENK
jgi:hypothetical protein